MTSEKRLEFTRSAPGPAYAGKLDPGIKDHGVAFVRKHPVFVKVAKDGARVRSL